MTKEIISELEDWSLETSFNCKAKIKNIIKRPVWAKDENRQYKVDTKMVNKCMKRFQQR